MRRINFTRRLKLAGNDVRFRRLPHPDGPLKFELAIDFTRLKKCHTQPHVDEAILVVEVYIGTRTERFVCGTVGLPQLGPHQSKQFRDGDRVQVRVKVADVAEAPGRLLALRQIRAGEEDATHQSLLPIDVRPLDGVPFKVEFGGQGEPPVLVLNDQLDDPNEPRAKLYAQSDKAFMALALPAAVREILTRYLIAEETPPSDDEDELQPHDEWYRFAQRFNSQPIQELFREGVERIERLPWIESAVQGLARDWNAVQKLKDVIQEGR